MSISQKKKQSDGSTSHVTKDKKDITCFRCKKKGHYMNKCSKANNSNGANNVFSATYLNGNVKATDFYIDSGCSTHLTARKDWMTNIRNPDSPNITVANNNSMSAECAGDIEIATFADNNRFEVKINNILYVPGLTSNLLSVSQLIKSGNEVIFEENSCKIYNKRGLIATAELIDNIYRLKFEPIFKPTVFAAAAVSGETWHRRFGHKL
ncbi:hypothetical protein PV328_008410 [Microctonus aethiopoides]|uniref:CCHC-type domain-containing protein n=1 Tax=Microctonus aethiopoides TaxID=144406 RepID=A0AA39KQW2_9HYME|nr:hypothetical protein PV328_008410 [Microctonus aethiopoides]